MVQVSGRASVVKTIIAVIFSPFIYRKQTLPSCPLPVAENRQAKQMSRVGGGGMAAAFGREISSKGAFAVGIWSGSVWECRVVMPFVLAPSSGS